MDQILVGAAAAVLASALFSVGVVLQALEARRVPTGPSVPFAVVGRLVRRRRWLLGVALMGVGFGFHATALVLAPLTVVQPALSAGLIVLLALAARTDGDAVGAREIAAVAAIALGLVGLTFSAPERTTVSAGPVALAVSLGVLAAVALAPYALAGRRHGRLGMLAPAVGAGAAYAVTAVTTKLFSDAFDVGDWVGAAVWLTATAMAGVLALVDQTAALQRGRTTQVGVIVYVLPVVLPVLGAPVLVGESWGSTPAGGLSLALSVAVVCVGAAILGGSQRIQALEHPSPVPET